MLRPILAAAVLGSMATVPVQAAPCRDSKGKFVKCPEKAAAKPAKCKDAKGKFAKCGRPGAVPVK